MSYESDRLEAGLGEEVEEVEEVVELEKGTKEWAQEKE